jgi:hypothetical protein
MSPYLMRTCSTIPSLSFGRLLCGMFDHSVFLHWDPGIGSTIALVYS